MSSEAVTFTVSLVNSTETLAALVTILKDLPPTSKPSLYLDLEGINLCRFGTISLLTLFHSPSNTSYLIDIHILGASAFTMSCAESKTTLKDVLEDPNIKKAFFDVRNDSDALFSHFGIDLKGVIDLQLWELGSRPGSIWQKRLVSGLARCIAQDSQMTLEEKKVWKEVKEKGTSLFAPEKGGSYEIWNERPLSEDLKSYCVQDVRYLPVLWEVYTARLGKNEFWKTRISDATLERVKESQSGSYVPHGRQKALGPWTSDSL